LALRSFASSDALDPGGQRGADGRSDRADPGDRGDTAEPAFQGRADPDRRAADVGAQGRAGAHAGLAEPAECLLGLVYGLVDGLRVGLDRDAGVAAANGHQLPPAGESERRVRGFEAVDEREDERLQVCVVGDPP
jgi:hypothetical protein